jgi:VanZ family protein
MSYLVSIRRGRFFRYAPLILWIGIVLFASTGNASMSETSRFIRPLLEFLFPGSPPETLVVYHNYIRKLAHFTEYGILAFFASLAFSNSARNFLRRNWFFAAFGIVLLTAAIDETNQSFNQARTGSIYDVMLDCAGGLTVILFFYLFKKFRNQKIEF